MKKKFFLQSQKLLLDPDEILADSISALNAGGTIWEGKIEKPIGRLSSIMFLCLIFFGMGYLVLRAHTLQISRGDELYAESQENRFFTRSIFPPRGIFYDMYHKPMVENIPSFGILFEKDIFANAAIPVRGSLNPCASAPTDIRNANISIRASTAQGINKGQATCAPLISSNPSQRLKDVVIQLGRILKKDESFFLSLGFPSDYALGSVPSRLVIARDIPLDMIAEISARRETLPGIEIVESYRRTYLYPHALSHVIGFIGKISERDMQNNPKYRFEESVGKNGLEQFYDTQLRGVVGKKIVEVDSRGRETHFRLTETPTSGHPLLLTLDGELQKATYDILNGYTNGKKAGSAVVVDVNTGAIRALVSFPGFDSNKLSSGMSANEFQQLLNDRLSPMFDRSIAGEFPSGSVIKPLFAAAAMQERIIDPRKKIYDEGFIEIPNPYRPGESSIFKDWKKHGWIDLYDAIAYSANVYFYMIGGGYQDQKGLGIDRLKKYANAFGLGSRLGIDLPGEKDGFFPDPSTKSHTNPENPVWRIGDTYNVSIGQGDVKITPLQITSVIAAIANGGTLYRPYLLDAVLDGERNVVQQVSPQTIRTGMIDKEYLHQTRIGMRQVVTEGTARSFNDMPIAVAAKTGTAQVGSASPHAWFVAFAPYEKPEIAITVMIEHGGEGSSVAAPITREILNWYFGYHGKTASNATSTSTPLEIPPEATSSMP
ncbi:MAG: penicillin-binding protein 2 [Patescibacteria group bacterium]|mgnify:FL=1